MGGLKNIMVLRPFNLLIIALTQFTFYHFLFQPLDAIEGVILVLNGSILYLFIFTTIIITVCGYLINDYFDFDGDIINAKRFRLAQRIHYLVLYFTLFFVGFLLSFWIAHAIVTPLLVLIYLAATLILFLYSSHFKNIPLLGNFVVAFFSAFVILILACFEYETVTFLWKQSHAKYFFNTLFFYACFVFLLTMVREIIKDIEDVQGDRAVGIRTLATKYSELSAKKVALLFVAILLLSQFVYLPTILRSASNVLLGSYILLTVIPSLILGFYLYKCKTQKSYSKLSDLSKINMILGIVFFIIYNL